MRSSHLFVATAVAAVLACSAPVRAQQIGGGLGSAVGAAAGGALNGGFGPGPAIKGGGFGDLGGHVAGETQGFGRLPHQITTAARRAGQHAVSNNAQHARNDVRQAKMRSKAAATTVRGVGAAGGSALDTAQSNVHKASASGGATSSAGNATGSVADAGRGHSRLLAPSAADRLTGALSATGAARARSRPKHRPSHTASRISNRAPHLTGDSAPSPSRSLDGGLNNQLDSTVAGSARAHGSSASASAGSSTSDHARASAASGKADGSASGTVRN